MSSYKITISTKNFKELIESSRPNIREKGAGKQNYLIDNYMRYFEPKINEHENLKFSLQATNGVYNNSTRASMILWLFDKILL